jgi:hypothetical protein
MLLDVMEGSRSKTYEEKWSRAISNIQYHAFLNTVAMGSVVERYVDWHRFFYDLKTNIHVMLV